MKLIVIFAVALLATNHQALGAKSRKIPKRIKMGVGTAAYQIEGAWNEDGKGESIWDHLLHEDPCTTADCKNGDNATDSYHKIERDVQMMVELGVDHYRFSISWPRILPEGFANQINEAGIAHYNKLIDELLKYGIEPIVTIFHYDLPESLQVYGGWLNPLTAEWFGDYARVVYQAFGDRVKKWATINEPYQICYYGFETADAAPAILSPGIGIYICTKNLLLGHAKAWHIYDDEFRSTQGGVVGLSINTDFFAPESDDQTNAADLLNEFYWGAYAHPIFAKTGDYPPTMKAKIAEKSASQGYPRSRLPDLTCDEIEYIKGTADFFGMNHYTTKLAYSNSSTVGINPVPSWADDNEVVSYQPAYWAKYEGEPIVSVPWGFTDVLGSVRELYNNPPVLVTENGYAYLTNGLDDEYRISYHQAYINALLDAVDAGSNVIGYTVWTLMDNFEWAEGYTEFYGLYQVDFNSTSYTRTARKSVKYYRERIVSRQITTV